MLDPVTAELRVAGFDADAGEEDEELPFVPEGEITTGETCAVIRLAIDDDFDKRALIAAGQPRAGLGTCCFAVLEVCGECGGITKWCNRMGLVTGPVIELKQGWDLFEEGLFLWLFRLALAGRAPDPGTPLYHFFHCPMPKAAL